MKSRMLMGIGAALLVSACSGISTTTDYDPAVNFSAFSTYDWIDSEGQVDNITSSRVRQSVDAAEGTEGPAGAWAWEPARRPSRCGTRAP